MILGVKIMHDKGYKALFYPGRWVSSGKLLAPLIFPRIDFVDVGIRVLSPSQ